MAPNGMILMIWGPVSIRRNDLHALSQSGVLAKWAAVMVPGTAAYYLYGDSTTRGERTSARGTALPRGLFTGKTRPCRRAASSSRTASG